MTTKKIVEGSGDIKKSVGDLRNLLSGCSGISTRIRFKRYGKKYIITNKNADISQMLKDSFDSFIHKLDMKEDGKTAGVCFLGDTNKGEFNICYQTGKDKIIRQIKGKLG